MAFNKAQLRIISGLIGNVRDGCCVIPTGHITFHGITESKVVDELESAGLVERHPPSHGVGSATAGWRTFGYVLLSDKELNLIIAALHHSGSTKDNEMADKLQKELDGRMKA